jgi:predicted helicase
MYRPFAKQRAYFDKHYIWSAYQMPSLFPTDARDQNVAISTSGVGKEFFALMVNTVIDRGMNSAGKCFPLYAYEAVTDVGVGDLGFDKEEGEIIDGYRRRDAITDGILKTFRAAYGAKAGGVSKEDIFYYVYGVLHSPEYRTRFAADLKKMLPRIPLTKEASDFKGFSEAGRELAKWHLNYETIEPWRVTEHSDALGLDPAEHFKVQKMTFARPSAALKAAGEKWDKTKIIYNSHITLSGIPLEAYEYVVNGKPAIEWIMERYQVTRDKDSGIVNDPNDWCKEHNEPRYIIDLVKRVVRVSIETMKIVKALPALNERK